VTVSANPFRARITRHTSKIVLSLPRADQLRFSIAGRWRDFPVEGPDPTVVTLRYRALKPNRSSESRLTEDKSLPLPFGVYYAELIVTDPSPVTDLEVTVTPVPALPAHLRPHEWSYANKAKAEAAAWAA
jgi:hypothetical protein